MEADADDVLKGPIYETRFHLLCFGVVTFFYVLDYASGGTTPFHLVTYVIIGPPILLSVPVLIAAPSLVQGSSVEHVFVAVGVAYLWFLFLPLRWLKKTETGVWRAANRKPILIQAILLALHAIIDTGYFIAASQPSGFTY